MGNLNYAAAKARVKGLVFGERLPHRVNLGGWRTQYPQDFPVTVTRMAGPEQTDSKMLSKVLGGTESVGTNPMDYNGHVPDDSATSKLEFGSGDLCACCLEEDPYYQAGYKAGYDAALVQVIYRMLEKMGADMERVRAEVKERVDAITSLPAAS